MSQKMSQFKWLLKIDLATRISTTATLDVSLFDFFTKSS